MSTPSYLAHPLTICLVLILVLCGTIPAASAQSGDSLTSGDTTVHVVQRGESLFSIAMLYGTTIEAISAANGIPDPRYLTAGQRLLIPNVRLNAPGVIVTHVVQPGDSLETLAWTYTTTLQSLITANKITNPAALYAGQELIVNAGAAEQPVFHIQALHHIQPGENLYKLAVTYNVSPAQLMTANGLITPGPLFTGQTLRIPGGSGGAELTDLPAPFVTFNFTPVPAVQGKTAGLRVKTDQPTELSGSFMDRPVQFFSEDGLHHYAVLGIHAFTAAGIYPFAVTSTQLDGATNATNALTFNVRVNDGGYNSETISLEPDQLDLLDTDVTEPEWQEIATAMSGSTSTRYFSGLMGLPSSGAITSQFGTRRDYNEGELKSFHSGTDFGGAPGSQITAPAPGVVVQVDTFPVRGNATVIDHGWGVYTGYWHQSEQYVQVGDFVSAGQIIGAIGNTGRSTGPHLHWEMWVSGTQIDPMQWVQQRFP